MDNITETICEDIELGKAIIDNECKTSNKKAIFLLILISLLIGVTLAFLCHIILPYRVYQLICATIISILPIFGTVNLILTKGMYNIGIIGFGVGVAIEYLINVIT